MHDNQTRDLAREADDDGDDAEGDQSAVQVEHDDPANCLCHDGGDQAVIRQIESLQGGQRPPKRVHWNGHRHVEGQEEHQEPRLADQILRDARDDVGKEDGEHDNAGERDEPEMESTRNEVLMEAATFSLSSSSRCRLTKAIVVLATPSSRSSRKGISEASSAQTP